MSKKNLAPGKEAHYYALLAWNGMNSQQAIDLVNSKTYAELDQTTYASGSVEAAKKGIEKHLLQIGQLDSEYITGDKHAPEGYFYSMGDKVVVNFDSEEELCDAIVKILEEIHDKWVVDNAKKYDRDKEKNDKRLYQHLPTALIGLDEVAKDLMFLAPILEKMGYPVGKMQENEWGAFVPSPAIAEAYQRYVNKYKAAHGITSEVDLENHIKNIASTYDALATNEATNEYASNRIAYMSEPGKVKVLVDTVKAKNDMAFGKTQNQPQ